VSRAKFKYGKCSDRITETEAKIKGENVRMMFEEHAVIKILDSHPEDLRM
jgi:hypothetical protein